MDQAFLALAEEAGMYRDPISAEIGMSGTPLAGSALSHGPAAPWQLSALLDTSRPVWQDMAGLAAEL